MIVDVGKVFNFKRKVRVYVIDSDKGEYEYIEYLSVFVLGVV